MEIFKNITFENIRLSLLAGIMIGVAGFANLMVGGIAGAVLFSFGLLSVCITGLHLFTGKAGIFELRKLSGWTYIIMVLVCNVIGTVIAAAMCMPGASDEALIRLHAILVNRENAYLTTTLLRAIMCGFIMEFAVHMYRNGSQFGIIYGVPLFILCGFYHSIADSFYYSAWMYLGGETLPYCLLYLSTILGNLIGCNLRRLFAWQW